MVIRRTKQNSDSGLSKPHGKFYLLPIFKKQMEMRKASYSKDQFPLEPRDEMLLYIFFQRYIRQTRVRMDGQVMNLKEILAPQIVNISVRRALAMAQATAVQDIVMLQKLLLKKESFQGTNWDLNHQLEWRFCYEVAVKGNQKNILLLEQVFEIVFKHVLALRNEADLYRGSKTTFAALEHSVLVAQVQKMEELALEKDKEIKQLRIAQKKEGKVNIIEPDKNEDESALSQSDVLPEIMDYAPPVELFLGTDDAEQVKLAKKVNKIKNQVKKLHKKKPDIRYPLHQIFYLIRPMIKQYFISLGNEWCFTQEDLSFIIMDLEKFMIELPHSRYEFNVGMMLVEENSARQQVGEPKRMSQGWLVMFESAIKNDYEALLQSFQYQVDAKSKEDYRSYSVLIKISPVLIKKIVEEYVSGILFDYSEKKKKQDIRQFRWDKLKILAKQLMEENRQKERILEEIRHKK